MPRILGKITLRKRQFHILKDWSFLNRYKILKVFKYRQITRQLCQWLKILLSKIKDNFKQEITSFEFVNKFVFKSPVTDIFLFPVKKTVLLSLF